MYVDEFNLIIFFLAVFRTIFFKDNKFIHNYFKILISLSKIKVFISDLDNYEYLWKLKKKISHIKILLIQNGIRGYKTDIFKNIKKNNDYKIDDFIVFNESIKKKYEYYIKGTYHVLGSYRLGNFLDNLKKKKIKTISKFDVLFICQYRRVFEKKNFDRDFKIIKILDNYCLDNNLIFKINLRPKNTLTKNFDKEYYEKMGIFKNKLLRPESSFDSYHNILKTKLVMTFNSTMGYESLSLYKKTIFLPHNINGNSSKLVDAFGWPKIMKKEGFFWSTNFSETRLKKMIANVFKHDKKKWNIKLKNLKKNICFQDKFFSKKTNEIIISYLKK